ncbi:uncharacterized protein LOC126677880 isoform X2 [Mercurialis annua]|uniref:uncharacterized protein LOC126677880 isoform X2 n=1 Tax=Mercurialis annua TaxID=3986 RepID=UPI0024AD8B9F|nr:uncharacterized protein LOC126677880 isoform X2 [Mercurialis annua]
MFKWIKQGTMIAVEKYNNLGKYPKMNLVQIRRATHWRTLYYVTFLAREECSRIIHTYRTLVFHIALNDRPATTQVFYIRSAPPRKHGEEESDDGEEESDDDEEESDDDEEEGKINIDRSSIVMEGGVASAAA